MDFGGPVGNHVPDGQAHRTQVKRERSGALIRPMLMDNTREEFGQPCSIAVVQRISGLNYADPIARALS